MNAVHKSEVLKTSLSFFDFIKMQERNEWVNAVKAATKNKVFNIVQEDGEMDVRIIPENQDFIPKASKFYEQYTKMQQKAIDQSD